jgi:hypothetical protein
MKIVLVSALLALLGCGSSGTAPHDSAPGDSASSEGPLDALTSDATDAESARDAIDASDADREAGGGDASVEHGQSSEAGLDVPDAAGADSACAAGCKSKTTGGTFCNAGETEWTCQSGNFNPTSFNAYCRDAGTNAIRYCCPASFVPLCD